MAVETITHRFPEAGLELVYDADSSPPDDLVIRQFDLSSDVAEYLSLKRLIDTLTLKQEICQQRITQTVGKGARYIKKRHGRGRKLKTLAIYRDYEIDLVKLHEFFRELGRPDIYDQSVRRGAPGRFVATCREEDRVEVLHDLAIAVEPLGVQLTPYEGSPFELFVHVPTLRRLCQESGILIRGVKNTRFTIRVYEKDLKSFSRKH